MNTYAQSALLGATTGIRSTSGALAAKWAESQRLPVASAMALGGEMVADKLPFVPSRITAGALVARAGGAVYAVRASVKKPSTMSYAVAIGAAVATAFAATSLRRVIRERTKVPDAVMGLAEDAIVAGLVYAAMRRSR